MRCAHRAPHFAFAGLQLCPIVMRPSLLLKEKCHRVGMTMFEQFEPNPIKVNVSFVPNISKNSHYLHVFTFPNVTAVGHHYLQAVVIP